MALPDHTKILVKELKGRRSICWYPSAGSDFRPLLYLSKPFYDKHEELSADKDLLPDLFIMTDFQMNEYTDCSGPGDLYYYDYMRMHHPNNFDKISKGSLRQGDILYRDRCTSITVKNTFRIFIDDIEVKKNLITFKEIPEWYGTGCCITVEVNSFGSTAQKLGKWETDIIYLYAENTAFAKQILIQNKINIDFIVRVRYGGNYGGSTNFGSWLFDLADTLNVKYYITDPINYEHDNWDTGVMEYLKKGTDTSPARPRLTSFYERQWYDNETVNWYRVER
ncbi:MAG: hypothetical protein J1F11_02640 [Oscillospiraceae bacterium]|nr:hypothetical protein [Oscillospiraceae bacterium]